MGMTREDIIGRLESIRDRNDFADLAFYAYRDLNRTDPEPFVLGAIERSPVSIAGSPVTISNLANGATEPVPFVVYDLPVPSGYLVAGTNVLAIQVFNTSLGSSDLVFDCALDAVLVDTTRPAVANVYPSAGTLTQLTQDHSYIATLPEAARAAVRSSLSSSVVAVSRSSATRMWMFRRAP